jgi:hypothetical protein
MMIAQAMKTRMEFPRLLGSLPFPGTIIAFFPKKAVALGTRWNEKELLGVRLGKVGLTGERRSMSPITAYAWPLGSYGVLRGRVAADVGVAKPRRYPVTSGAIGGSDRYFPRARFRFRERGESPLRSADNIQSAEARLHRPDFMAVDRGNA